MTQEMEPVDKGQQGKITTSSFAQRVAGYLEDTAGEQQRILRPHQTSVFSDLQSFFQQGRRRGHIEMPTGTGKTVLFVELSKALLGQRTKEDKKLRILVVTPTKDLVHQTLGRSGKKGYGKFAPDLRVSSYFSDTPDSERMDINKSGVVVTTYRSFDIMSSANEYKPVENFDKDVLGSDFFRMSVERNGYTDALKMAKAIKNVPTGRTLLNTFDVIIFDESQSTEGPRVSEIIRSLPEEKVVIGLSATPGKDVLPYRIHKLELNEAIMLGLLDPIVPIGVKSGVRIQGSDIFDENGEFLDSKLSYLMEDEKRNNLIVQVAKIMVEHGKGTIISCLAGNEAWQARHIAELGQKEGLRIVAVHDRIPAEDRLEIYEQFENGEIDVLSFVGVLGVGWDSNRAKAIINARPSRSSIFTKQRLGRITRPTEGVGFVIDICDENDGENPPITAADVLESGDIVYGTAVGTIDKNSGVAEILDSLRTNVPVLEVLKSGFVASQEFASKLPKLKNGVLENGRYALPSVIDRLYSGVTEEILLKMEKLSGRNIDTKLATRGKIVRAVYDVDQARRLLRTLSQVDPSKYYVDKQKHRWISAEGIVKLFSNRFPKLSEREVGTFLAGANDIEWIPTSYFPQKQHSEFQHNRVIKMFSSDQAALEAISNVIRHHRDIRKA